MIAAGLEPRYFDAEKFQNVYKELKARSAETSSQPKTRPTETGNDLKARSADSTGGSRERKASDPFNSQEKMDAYLEKAMKRMNATFGTGTLVAEAHKPEKKGAGDQSTENKEPKPTLKDQYKWVGDANARWYDDGKGGNVHAHKLDDRKTMVFDVTKKDGIGYANGMQMFLPSGRELGERKPEERFAINWSLGNEQPPPPENIRQNSGMAFKLDKSGTNVEEAYEANGHKSERSTKELQQMYDELKGWSASVAFRNEIKSGTAKVGGESICDKADYLYVPYTGKFTNFAGTPNQYFVDVHDLKAVSPYTFEGKGGVYVYNPLGQNLPQSKTGEGEKIGVKFNTNKDGSLDGTIDYWQQDSKGNITTQMSGQRISAKGKKLF
jgi:hypothetical protein